MWVPSLEGKLRSHVAGELSPHCEIREKPICHNEDQCSQKKKKKKNRKKNRSIQMINSEELKEVNRASKAWS